MVLYMDLAAAPLFAFGEGLSYTRFQYANLRFNGTSHVLSVDVTNAGERDGCETAEIYIRDCVSSVLTPVRRLIAFEKAMIKAGETRTLSFPLTRDDFSLVTPDEKRIVEPGRFILMAGPSSKEEELLALEVVL